MAVQVSTYLNYARVTQYLAADGSSKRLLFQGSDSRVQQAALLFMTRKVINWLNTLDSSDSRLPNMANYMYSLCNPYIPEARRIINSNDTGNIVNPSTGQNVTIATPFVQFRVGDAGSPMTAGETTLTLNYSGVVNPSIEITVDGVEMPYAEDESQSYSATYNPTNVQIVFTEGVSNGQLFIIHMVQLVNV